MGLIINLSWQIYYLLSEKQNKHRIFNPIVNYLWEFIGPTYNKNVW